MKRRNYNYSPTQSIAVTAGRATAETIIHEGGKIISEHIKYRYWEKRRHAVSKNVDELLSEINSKLDRIEFGRPGQSAVEDPLQYYMQNQSDDNQPEDFADSIKRGANAPARKWIAPMLMKEGGVYNVFSPEKAGKSILADQIALNCSFGADMDFVPKDGEKYPKAEVDGVLLFDAEQNDDDIYERYGAIMNMKSKKLKRFGECSFSCWEEMVAQAAKNLGEGNQLLIFDNMTALCPSLSNNKVLGFMKMLKELRDKVKAQGHRLTIILVTHATKEATGILSSKDRSGAANYGRFADGTICLSHTQAGDKYRFISAANLRFKDGLSDRSALLVELMDEPYPYFQLIKQLPIDEAKTLMDVNEDYVNGVDPKDVVAKVPPGVKKAIQTHYLKHHNSTYGYGSVLKWVNAQYGKSYGLKYMAQIKRIVEMDLSGEDEADA